MIFGGDQSLAIAVTEIRAFMEHSGVMKGVLA
jgi:hypothetical protein